MSTFDGYDWISVSFHDFTAANKDMPVEHNALLYFYPYCQFQMWTALGDVLMHGKCFRPYIFLPHFIDKTTDTLLIIIQGNRQTLKIKYQYISLTRIINIITKTRLVFCKKALLHWLHRYGCSPVCVFASKFIFTNKCCHL